MNKSIIEIRNLSVGHKKEAILENINVSLSGSSMIALMGVNGCGKTTLLKTLSGLLPSISGCISLYGTKLDNLDIRSKAKIISVVLTERPELNYLTVFEVLKLARFVYNETPKGSHDKIIEFSELLKISHLLELNFSILSDGQKQIVLLCRALVQDTKVIVLDEPFTFLDIPKKLEVINLFKTIIQKTNKTLIFSTHDLEIVYNLNIETLLVQDNKTIYFDNIRLLTKSGKIESVFGHPDFHIDEVSGRFIHIED